MNSCKSDRVCCTKLNNISVKIDEKYLVKDINIHLHCSELTAILGPNGAGKSTLLKAILNDIKHTGTLTYETHKAHNIKKPLIGYVPQEVTFDKLYPMSVYDMVASTIMKKPLFMFKNWDISKKVEDILKIVKAEGLKHKKVGELSGGELQRVILAIALNPMPDILLLDEPVSGIDNNGLKLFYEIVSTIKTKYDITILLVSHDFNMIEKYADKIILLNKEVLKVGNPEEVFKSKEFKKIF